MTVLRVALLGFLMLAVAHGQTSRGPILDKIIRDILEKVRPALNDMQIPDQQFNTSSHDANITASFEKGLIQKLDKFVLTKLSTTLIPLKVTNFTVTLEEVKLTGVYSLNGTMTMPSLPGNITIYGDGDAKVVLKGILFTIAGDFVYKDGKFQIPPKGLYGFDVYVSQCQVELENLLGGGEKGKIINDFLSFLIPDIVRDYKKTFFEMVRDPLIKLVNDALGAQTHLY